MTKRILAMTLCLALTLLACACAASNATVSAPESSDNKGESSIDLSTMEQLGTSLPVAQMSSQTVSTDLELEPTEPIIPEERETILEKVLSFDIGMDGVFEYWFKFDLDASKADIYLPGAPFADGNGIFYQIDNFEIVRLNDGARLPFSIREQILDAVASKDVLYVLYADNCVRKFDLQSGFECATLIKEYSLDTHFGSLYSNGDDEPYFYANKTFYTLDMQPIPAEKLPYLYVQAPKGDSLAVTMNQNGCYTVLQAEGDTASIHSISKDGIVLMQSKSKSQTGTTTQKIYTSYSPDGEMISRYMYQEGSLPEKQPCELKFEFDGGIETVTQYRVHPTAIDDFWFETALDSMMIFDQDGIAYLIVYFPNRGEIYRIDPGYSDVQFTTKES